MGLKAIPELYFIMNVKRKKNVKIGGIKWGKKTELACIIVKGI